MIIRFFDNANVLSICSPPMKISIPPTHIAIFTNRTKAAISNARTRLAKRLLGEQNSTEKLDDFISDLQ